MFKELIIKHKLKQRLIKAFNDMGLYKTYKNSSGQEIRSYPKIYDVNNGANQLSYTFTLLNGMDPKEIKKKDYILQQHYGKNIEIDGDLKKFVLTIYKTTMPDILKYDFEQINPVITPYRIGIICGKNKNGEYIAFDLLKHPHILIAGETGSGKSSQIRSILTTLILSKKPYELELYLADCKKSEFHIFRNVEHVKCVHSKPNDIVNMLRNIKKELDVRSDLTEKFEVSHIDELPKEHKKPYVIVCIDEFVMLRKNEEIMDILTEIVAIGRTLGVFAILSMQRPNAKVLDTTIRANLTVSMGFKLRDITEARIVNTPNAEKIEKSGRFVMNSDKLYELQAPFLDIQKAKKLLEPFIVKKRTNQTEEKEMEIRKPLTEEDVFLDAFNKKG